MGSSSLADQGLGYRASLPAIPVLAEKEYFNLRETAPRSKRSLNPRAFGLPPGRSARKCRSIPDGSPAMVPLTSR